MEYTQARVDTLAYVGKKPGSRRDSNSWFTPPAYIELVRKVLGSIDLDPFSSPEANRVVGATRYLSVSQSAFEHEWPARTVFMNPPYSSNLIGRASARFLNQWKKHRFTAIVLTNNSTETKWFQGLLCVANAICFVNHRISFWSSDGKATSGNTRGQVFFYFGSDVDQFRVVFGSIGKVVAL